MLPPEMLEEYEKLQRRIDELSEAIRINQESFGDSKLILPQDKPDDWYGDEEAGLEVLPSVNDEEEEGGAWGRLYHRFRHF